MNRKTLLAGILFFSTTCLTGFYHQGAKDYVEMGQMLVAEGLNDAALSYFTKAINLEPKNTDFLLTRAFFLLKLNRHSEALTDLTAIIDLQPGVAEGYLTRGLVYSELGQKDLARGDFSAACRLGDQGGCAFMGEKD